jgi:hypothetical protein
MNVWRRKLISQNPYLRNAFRVAMMPREATERVRIAEYLGEARDIVSADAQAHRIGGTAVTPEEINQAEAVLMAPEERILEELLVHSTEALSLDRLRQLDGRAAEAMTPRSEAVSVGIRPEALTVLLHDLVSMSTEQLPKSEPWLGALETGLTAPFGPQEGV